MAQIVWETVICGLSSFAAAMRDVSPARVDHFPENNTGYDMFQFGKVKIWFGWEKRAQIEMVSMFYRREMFVTTESMSCTSCSMSSHYIEELISSTC